MRILLLNQAFYPDVVSSGQHLTDLAVSLAHVGHDVTVVAAASGYDDPSRRFPYREKWKGVEVIRIAATHLGKPTGQPLATGHRLLRVSLCWFAEPELIFLNRGVEPSTLRVSLCWFAPIAYAGVV